jgi:hypothetical protein
MPKKPAVAVDKEDDEEDDIYFKNETERLRGRRQLRPRTQLSPG